LSLGDALAFGTRRHGDAICERGRGDAVVAVIDGFNQAVRDGAPK
jgi:hypothetical protein